MEENNENLTEIYNDNQENNQDNQENNQDNQEKRTARRLELRRTPSEKKKQTMF